MVILKNSSKKNRKKNIGGSLETKVDKKKKGDIPQGVRLILGISREIIQSQ